MNKIFTTFLLWIILSSTSLAENYYFKECQLSNAVLGNYIINFDKNVIEVNLLAVDGATQNFSDKIKLVEKNKIVSEKIKSAKGENIFYQYFLNSKSQTVVKLEYTKESGIDLDVFKLKSKRESYCSEVKTDWNKIKIENEKASKEQKEILKAKEKIKKEQSSLIECQDSDYKIWTRCKGSFTAESGHKYTGLFISGKIVKGISIYPGGAKYVGEFKNFQPNGYGTFVWANGDKYVGGWQAGKTNGNGTKVWKDGREYLGTFKNDKLHGKGTLFYPNGEKYVGGFINGKRHGEGTFSYSDGSAYIGKFINGKQQGEGECISIDGLSVPCESRTITQKKDFSGKDTRNISIISKKWVRISQYETNTKKGKKIMDKLKIDFDAKALEG